MVGTDRRNPCPFVLEICAIVAPLRYMLWAAQIDVDCITFILYDFCTSQHDLRIVTAELEQE